MQGMDSMQGILKLASALDLDNDGDVDWNDFLLLLRGSQKVGGLQPGENGIQECRQPRQQRHCRAAQTTHSTNATHGRQHQVEVESICAQGRQSLETLSRIPLFILMHTFFVGIIWIVGSYQGANKDLFHSAPQAAGLYTYWEGSALRLASGLGPCEDVRAEVWRFWTYQFSHVGLAHVGMNCFMNLVLGVPLEKFHGSLRMLAFYMGGVLGGALCYAVADAHSIVVGCSGGVYALLGMHLGDLMINWSDKPNHYRLPVLFFLIAVAAADFLAYTATRLADQGGSQVAHAAHIGGFITGAVFMIVLGKNENVKTHEQVSRVVAFVLGCCLLVFACWWDASHWPPRNIFEELSSKRGPLEMAASTC